MNKVERLENALLDYIEKNVEDTTTETAATIPEVARVLVELWKAVSSEYPATFVVEKKDIPRIGDCGK